MEYKINNSLYSKLVNALNQNNGHLPEDFILNEENIDGDVVFNEGSFDTFFRGRMEEKDAGPYVEALIEASNGNLDEAFKESEQNFQKNDIRYIQIESSLKDWLDKNQSLMQKKEVSEFIKERINASRSAEELKFLLACCGAINEVDKELQKMLLNISYSSELAEYTYPAIKKFKDGNERIFEIAKNTDEYAKAEAIYALDADTEEKKLWLIYNGRPSFIDWYSTAAVIARKCDFESMLKDPNLTTELRDQIGFITSKFFEEGPAVGLSKLNNWDGICSMYIQMVKNNPTVDGICSISDEYENLERYDSKKPKITSLMAECQDVLNDKSVLAFAKDKMDHEGAFFLSKVLDIPVNEPLVLKTLQDDFKHNFPNVQYITNPSLQREAFNEMFKNTDLDAMLNDKEEVNNNLIYFLPALAEDEFLKGTSEEFTDKCQKILQIGLTKTSDFSYMYFTALSTADNMLKKGLPLSEENMAVLKEIHEKEKEEEKEKGIKNALRKSIRNAQKKEDEKKAKMS